jgi:hypothetical protein
MPCNVITLSHEKAKVSLAYDTFSCSQNPSPITNGMVNHTRTFGSVRYYGNVNDHGVLTQPATKNCVNTTINPSKLYYLFPISRLQRYLVSAILPFLSALTLH